jgi:MFS superfamily sulfate permease-like transporter
MIQFTRNLFFFNKAQLRRAIQSIPSGSNVLIDGTKSEFMDFDIKQTFQDFCSSAKSRDINITLKKSETAVIDMFKNERTNQ